MLIGLVKDSVLRCFCHTCSVNSAVTGRHLQKKPLSKKTNKKPRCKQPKRKRFYHATEIRCEEKSRGGMAYEMVLAEPISDKPDPSVATPRQKVSMENINIKLNQAEERRKSLEASKLVSVGERLARLQEVGKKREENNLAFIASSQKSLEQKFEANSSNREAHLKTLRSKITEHLVGVENVRKQLDAQSAELREAINLKIVSAQENREEHIKKNLDKLKEQDDHAKKVRLRHEESIDQLKERIQSKLSNAEANRLSEQQKKIEILKEHERRAEAVRANKEKLVATQNGEHKSSG